ncbi:MAG: hypothetical protein E7022_02980 [Desulfovibrio desulfuricans]|nr:hypothetical protein [Desulfovibrio desulfuricans]
MSSLPTCTCGKTACTTTARACSSSSSRTRRGTPASMRARRTRWCAPCRTTRTTPRGTAF